VSLCLYIHLSISAFPCVLPFAYLPIYLSTFLWVCLHICISPANSVSDSGWLSGWTAFLGWTSWLHRRFYFASWGGLAGWPCALLFGWLDDWLLGQIVACLAGHQTRWTCSLDFSLLGWVVECLGLLARGLSEWPFGILNSAITADQRPKWLSFSVRYIYISILINALKEINFILVLLFIQLPY
jgi:hypothetical protein